jgi:hypothetical protein
MGSLEADIERLEASLKREVAASLGREAGLGWREAAPDGLEADKQCRKATCLTGEAAADMNPPKAVMAGERARGRAARRRIGHGRPGKARPEEDKVPSVALTAL